MASTLNSTPAANSSGNANNASQNSGRPSLRSSANSRADGRRQSGSPGDAGQRYVRPLQHSLSTCSPLSLSLAYHKLENAMVVALNAHGRFPHSPLVFVDLMALLCTCPSNWQALALWAGMASCAPQGTNCMRRISWQLFTCFSGSILTCRTPLTLLFPFR